MAPLVSAHRGGAEGRVAQENSAAAIEAAVALGCDYVEVDVRLTCDGRPVLFHDPHLAEADQPLVIAEREHADVTGAGLLDLDVALDLLAGRAGAHLDLKVPHGEVAVVSHVVTRLGVDHVVVTTAEDQTLPRLRTWATQHAPGLRLGLSTAAPAHDGRWVSRCRSRVVSWFPRTRMRRAGVDVVVAHHLVARWWLRSWARRRGLALLVWTVDGEDSLRRWVNDTDTWMVTTNHPRRALTARRD